MTKNISGDTKSFEKEWQTREEKWYSHWVRGQPQNQIQFAFRNHWEVFNELMAHKRFNKGKRCLEVGCGRGSISAYFSDAGYDCTLLDISAEAIKVAKKIFADNQLRAKFVEGDVKALPFESNSFDLVISIGLLEHFENIELPIREQIRVLDKGGLFIGYIVPKYSDNIQKDYNWINEILKGYARVENTASKQELFRSGISSSEYIKIMKSHGLKSAGSSGIYSLPAISHSIDFPFTLMPPVSEQALLKYFYQLFKKRRKIFRKHPWLCPEGYGQAFLVWGYK